MSQSKNFVVTNFNVEADYQDIIKNNNIQYLAYGAEKCPTTGRDHHQCFFVLKKKSRTSKRTLNKMGDWFGPVHCNIEAMGGNLEQNERYCSKESALVEFGQKPEPRKRTDLKRLHSEMVAETTTVDDILNSQPDVYHQYGRTLEKIAESILQKKKRTWFTEGIYVWGPSGTGKSHFAAHYNDYTDDQIYYKNTLTQWWCGYQTQPLVIFNDFRPGRMAFDDILNLVDKWQHKVPVRNKRDTPFLARTLIITSCLPPELCFNVPRDQFDQFHRRFRVIHLTEKFQQSEQVVVIG